MAPLALAMPVELLRRICESLDHSDLKSCRLVCKHFRYTSEIFLFRRIYLRRNVESFMRFRLIADHPTFRKHVKSLFYDTRLLSGTLYCMEFENWNSSVLSRRPRCTPVHREFLVIRDYAQKLEPKELQAHYQRYCAFYHSEKLMHQYDVETQDLMSGFAKLPQLREVCFMCHEDKEEKGVWSFHELSLIAQETLIEPNSPPGLLHAKSFTAVLEAAYAVQRPLKTIKALGVPWSFFQQSKGNSSMMASATESCQYLAIEMYAERNAGVDFENDRENRIGSLANMISSSPSLHTLDISFRLRGYDFAVKLSEIIDPKVHWPYLKRLKLQALAATDVALKNLLSRHTTTLRSLELSRIRLQPYQLDGKWYYGSWTDIIVFLQGSLSLEEVCLHGDLCNGDSEMWLVQDLNPGDDWWPLRSDDLGQGPSLKVRIERFIVEGGTCPLPLPPKKVAPCGDFFPDPSWQQGRIDDLDLIPGP